MTRGRGATVAAVLTLVVATASCSGDDSAEVVPPGPGEETTSTTALVDYTGVALGPVRGTTSTTAPVGTGTSSIVGVVAGPAGPVAGATVRIERLVGGAPVSVDVLSDAVGHYELRNVPGGRYRVRAFLAPTLAMVTSSLQFVTAGTEQVVDLAMTDQRGIRVRAAVAPSAPVLDEDVNLAVIVVSRRVDADGVVRGVPVTNARVELDGLGLWELRRGDQGGFTPPGRLSSTTTTTFGQFGMASFTDFSGRATFELRCVQAGPPELGLRLSVTVVPPTVPGEPPSAPVPQLQTIPLELPDCVDPTVPVVDPNESTTTIEP